MSLPARLELLAGLHGELAHLAEVCLGLLRGQGPEELCEQALADTLARRREVFARLAALHGEMAPLLADWPRAGRGLGAGEAARAEDLLDTCRRQALRRRDLEKELGQRLQARLEDMGRELARFKQGRQLAQAYGRRVTSRNAPPVRVSLSR